MRVKKEIKITVYRQKIHVLSPHDLTMNERFKEIGGRWCPSRKVWIIRKGFESEARQAVKDAWGKDSGWVEIEYAPSVSYVPPVPYLVGQNPNEVQ